MKISIVVPSYNHDAFLRDALDSILGQGYPDLEVLVNDGGSKDRTCEILASYGERISWSSGSDRGQTDAINKGLRAAQGEILAYLNSDDVYLPESLATVAAYFSAHPECDLLYGDAWHLNVDGSVREAYPTQPWDYEKLFETCYLCQPAVFWRRRLQLRHGVFDERLNYAMDYEYWLRAGASANVQYLPGSPLAGSRLHTDTKTLKARLPVHREILAVVRAQARRPEECYAWLRHLASLEASDLGYPHSLLANRQAAHLIAYSAQVLALAEQYRIELDDRMLAEIRALISEGATP